jgi:hypothetical protein
MESTALNDLFGVAARLMHADAYFDANLGADRSRGASMRSPIAMAELLAST